MNISEGFSDAPGKLSDRNAPAPPEVQVDRQAQWQSRSTGRNGREKLTIGGNNARAGLRPGK